MATRFRADGNLEEGIHQVDWAELAARFGYNETRAAIMTELLGFCRLLHAGKCTELYIDGSFVTAKDQPGDIDVCFDALTVDETLFFLWTWAAQKKQFPLMDIKPDFAGKYLTLFQIMKQGDTKKGIVCLRLDTLPTAG